MKDFANSLSVRFFGDTAIFTGGQRVQLWLCLFVCFILWCYMMFFYRNKRLLVVKKYYSKGKSGIFGFIKNLYKSRLPMCALVAKAGFNA